MPTVYATNRILIKKGNITLKRRLFSIRMLWIILLLEITSKNIMCPYLCAAFPWFGKCLFQVPSIMCVFKSEISLYFLFTNSILKKFLQLINKLCTANKIHILLVMLLWFHDISINLNILSLFSYNKLILLNTGSYKKLLKMLFVCCLCKPSVHNMLQ